MAHERVLFGAWPASGDLHLWFGNPSTVRVTHGTAADPTIRIHVSETLGGRTHRFVLGLRRDRAEALARMILGLEE